MKTLPTQFDSGRLSPAVGTPSCCGSSCCCCCCIGTVAGASMLVGMQVNHEAKVNNAKRRGLWVTLAALFVPIAALVGVASRVLMEQFFRNCYVTDRGNETCLSPAPEPAFFIAVVAAIAILWLAYWRARHTNPFLIAIAATSGTVVALVVEAGAILLGISMGFGFLIWLGILIAAIALPVRYSKKLHEDEASGA